MAKETKTQAQERLFNEYVKNYNAIPDYDSFLSSCKTEKDKKVFTPQTFKNYFFKHFEGSKELMKAFKDGEIKKDDYVLETFTICQNTIKGQLYGSKKENVVICYYNNSFKIKEGKKLFDKKLDKIILVNYEIDMGPVFGKHFEFFSSIYGHHIRTTECFLSQFVETAKLRKRFEVR